MAKIKLLVDTDIIIDFLRGIRAAKSLFISGEIEIYCSVLSKKELLSKVGLSESERKRVMEVLSIMRVLNIDNDICRRYSELLEKYGDRPDMLADYVIAATAWSKKLPLLTRNKKHFSKIQEIILAPGYA